MKTSHLYAMTVDHRVRLAAIDTHVLKFLGEDFRKQPSKKKYLELEQRFLAEADKRGITPFELDQIVWHEYAK